MNRSTRTCAIRITILTNVFFAGRAVVFQFRCPAVTVLNVKQLFDSRFLAKSLGWDFDLACSSPF